MSKQKFIQADFTIGQTAPVELTGSISVNGAARSDYRETEEQVQSALRVGLELKRTRKPANRQDVNVKETDRMIRQFAFSNPVPATKAQAKQQAKRGIKA